MTDVTTAQIAKRLSDGQTELRVSGFGTFTVVERAARTGRNPKTGEPVDVPAKRVVTFKPSKALRDAVNDDRRVPRYGA